MEGDAWSWFEELSVVEDGRTVLVWNVGEQPRLVQLGPDGNLEREVAIVSDGGTVDVSDMAKDEEGGILLVGSIELAGNVDGFWLKLDRHWNTEWQGSRGGDGNLFFRAAAARSDGWIVADVGPSFWQLDRTGAVVATVHYGSSPGLYNVSDIVPIGDDRFVVTGTCFHTNTTRNDIYMATLEADLSWTRPTLVSTQSSDHMRQQCTAIGPNGEVWLAGSTRAFEATRGSNWILRWSSSGNLELAIAIDGYSPMTAVATADGGLMVIREVWRAGSMYATLYAVDAAGTLQWERQWDAATNAGDLAAAGDGYMAAAPSESLSSDAVVRDALLVRMDVTGTIAGGCMNELSATQEVFDAPPTLTPITFTTFGTMVPPSERAVHLELRFDAIRDPCQASGAPPLEVSGPHSLIPLRVWFDGTITWESSVFSNSETFDIHRSTLDRVRETRDYGGCWRTDLSSTECVDPDEPPPGGCWTYLVVGRNGFGRGPLGQDSSGQWRVTTTPCP